MPAERRPLRIGINALFLLPGQIGGAEVYVRDLLRALALVDDANTYYVYRNVETGSDLVPEATNFIDCPQPVRANNRPARIVYEQTLLVASILRHRNDVLLNVGFTAPLLAPLPMATIVYDLQYKHHPECFGKLDLIAWRFLVPLSARRSKRVIVMSQDTRADVEANFPWASETLALVPHGTDPAMALVATDRAARTPEPMLLCVSALRAHKNLENLVRAFARFHALRPEYRLVVVGPRDQMAEPLEALRDELGLRDAIEFTGWIARADLLAYFVRARALVFPSLFEGFGIPILEALTARLPIACSNIAPVRELARDAAIYFDPADVADMAAALLSVTAEDPSRMARVDEGERNARAFTWPASATSLREALVSCARSAGTDGSARRLRQP